MSAPDVRVIDAFLDAVAAIRATRAGTPETSHYPAVTNLLDGIGKTLRPRVLCVPHPSGGEAGIPDFGLFEQAQFRRGEPPAWAAAVTPQRGVVEAKPVRHGIAALLASEQVRKKYLPAYRLVLACNLWQWRLLDASGAVRETFDLAADEAGFRALLHGRRPRPLLARFADFLQRCLLTRAPLGKPADVAFFLASYARDALMRLAEHADLPALAALRKAMQTALGVEFDAGEGEHLFRSTLVQTLFYGLFSAWVAHVREGNGRFDWRSAQWSLHVPIAQFLFGQVANPRALQGLDLVPLLDAAQDTLARVDREAFFRDFEDALAVQYFYEPFLELFDPALRKQLGVWYTPPDIVRYMVERVDRVLRSELGVADGLADERVWVLDPCCGTGSFIVAVLDRIRRTLHGKDLGDLLAERLKRAAQTRIVGFEIMTAPFIVAHWQVGEAMRRVQVPFAAGERAAIYLTNALTGWEDGPQPAIPGFEALVAEAGAAGAVKREQPILVVLGNPPYNAYAGVSPQSERGLVEPYKDGLQAEWGVKKFNLDDLYVRFFRIAERRIVETTGRGVVCYISNHSWLSGTSYTVMRRSLVRGFDRMWIENMHGDRKITEYGPDGRSSETIFATQGFSPGIRQGVATALLVRTGRNTKPRYLLRDDIDASKAADRRAQLLASLDDPDFESRYAALNPARTNRFLLRPGAAGADYAAWPTVRELSRAPDWSGLLELRKGALFGHELPELEARMARYLDPRASLAALQAQNIGPVFEAARFDPTRARMAMLRAGGLSAGRFARIALYPFDLRWCFHTNVRPVWNEPRPEVAAQERAGTTFLVARASARRPQEGFPCFLTTVLPGDHLLDPKAHPIPFVLHTIPAKDSLQLSAAAEVAPNLSDSAMRWLAALALPASAGISRLAWLHVLATCYSPAWLNENAAGIRQDWPRVPLPRSADLLRTSASLGEQVAALLDPQASVPGVNAGDMRPELAAIAVPTTIPGAPRDWRLTAGWGSRTDKGVTMPGRGRAEPRAYAAGEAATAAHAALLGARTFDVWMNGASYWRNVPEAVWDVHIGGYQVLKKWLSYRDHSILARPLNDAEVEHVHATARRLAAVLLLGPALDENYRACAAAHMALP